MRSPRAVELHPEAVAEAQAAGEWYDKRSPSLARSFLVELDQAMGRIVNLLSDG